MEKPKYTFLLPAYKAKFFEEALLSIKNQTYTDFLCIVSDDCSPEDLKTIYDKTVGDDDRFSYRRNEHNMGSKSLVSHWNLLVDLCQTEYLIMASDDDVYVPRFLKEMNRLSEKYPDAGLLRAKINRIDADGHIIADDAELPEYNECGEACFNMYSKRGYIHCMQNNVFKTSVLREVGKCVDFPLAWFSDNATVMACSKYGVVNTSEVLFLFRSSALQISDETQTPLSICVKKIKAAGLFKLWVESRYDKKVSKLAIDRAWWIAGIYLKRLTFWDRVKLIPIISQSKLYPLIGYIKSTIYLLLHRK